MSQHQHHNRRRRIIICPLGLNKAVRVCNKQNLVLAPAWKRPDYIIGRHLWCVNDSHADLHLCLVFHEQVHKRYVPDPHHEPGQRQHVIAVQIFGFGTDFFTHIQVGGYPPGTQVEYPICCGSSLEFTDHSLEARITRTGTILGHHHI